jgi:hypothetical protein
VGSTPPAIYDGGGYILQGSASKLGTRLNTMIEPRYGVLQTLFADRVFRIPHYQRFYSWQKRQRDDLFSDLRKLADRGEGQHHFMATIVCQRTAETKCWSRAV